MNIENYKCYQYFLISFQNFPGGIKWLWNIFKIYHFFKGVLYFFKSYITNPTFLVKKIID